MSNVDFSKITEGIYHVIETEEKILTGLQNDTITLKRNKQNRTIKQILGHLIDSASNNHQRMVRLQYSKDLLFFPDYRQDNDLWIALQDYQNEDCLKRIAVAVLLYSINIKMYPHGNLHSFRKTTRCTETSDTL